MIGQDFEPKASSEVVSELFYGNNVSVKVDDENSYITKILSNSEFLVKTPSGKTFKITSDNERVKYRFSEFSLEGIDLSITLSDPSLHRALKRLILAKDEDGVLIDDMVDIHRLVGMYKCLVEQPIQIHRDTDSTQFVLILKCTSENLYDKASYDKHQLQLFELLSQVTITLSCYIMYLPDTAGLDLQKYKYSIARIKEKVLVEINRAPDISPCEINVFIDH